MTNWEELPAEGLDAQGLIDRAQRVLDALKEGRLVDWKFRDQMDYGASDDCLKESVRRASSLNYDIRIERPIEWRYTHHFGDGNTAVFERPFLESVNWSASRKGLRHVTRWSPDHPPELVWTNGEWVEGMEP